MLGFKSPRAWTVAFAFVAAFVAAPSAALASTETVSAGGVTATFSFTATSPSTSSGKALTISRAGQVVYSQPVTSRHCGAVGSPSQQQFCVPGGVPGQSSVHVVPLQPGPEPNVVLDLYTGGAHCCSVEQVFSFDPATGTYTRSERSFGNPGAHLVDLGHRGRFEFLTADDSFAYAFTDYADSGLPLEILAFANGRFANVTRHYPQLIAGDAAKYLKAFKHDLSNGDGLIAAWAADEDSLGHTRLVAATLAKYLKAGKLHGLAYPSGQKFVKALGKLLRKDGYVR